MSETENAQAGAEVAPVVAAEPQPVQAQASDSTPEQDAQQQEQARDDKGRFVQQRINELTRARREAERERDYYRQQAEANTSRQPQYSQPQEGLPSLSSFNSAEEWGAAVAEYSARQALSQAEQRFATAGSPAPAGTGGPVVRGEGACICGFRTRTTWTACPRWPACCALHPKSWRRWPLPTIRLAIAYHLATHLDEADRHFPAPRPHRRCADRPHRSASLRAQARTTRQ